MRSKIKQLLRYLAYIIVSNAIYGIIVYNVFTWLAGYSLSFAYLGNFALIVLGLALDEYTCKEYQSEKFAADLKTAMQKSGKASKSYRIIRWHMDNFVSFKTVLYLFYIFILVASHIIAYNPALASEAFGNFIMANEYTILILIALDLLIRQFSIDRRKMRETSEKLERALAEDKD